MKRKLHFGDGLEEQVALILNKKGINYIHESEDKDKCQSLDFYLPDFEIYIEVKRFHSFRSNAQLQKAGNVILIQGYRSVQFLDYLLKSKQ